jgi:thiol-disulfide isomerase/thioredoxin
MTRWLLVAALFIAGHAIAGELRVFGSGSLGRLLAERESRPVAITFWSIDCPHCKGTLKQLSTLLKQYPDLDLLVVSTDSLDARSTIDSMLASTGFGARPTWVFGAEAPERLRYEIDRRWGGEMPRTYLYDSDRKVVAFSGKVPDAAIAEWLARNAIARKVK